VLAPFSFVKWVDILQEYLDCALLCDVELHSYPLASRRIYRGCALAGRIAPSALLLRFSPFLLPFPGLFHCFVSVL
ncbi:hypothetical protein Tco_0483196, partial [Tanacetum coccineum]